MKSYSLYILAIVVVLSSCIKEIEFKSKDVKPRLVVNAKLRPDSTLSVHVSHSLNVLDQAQINFLGNADVKLLDGSGNLIEQFYHDTEGFYRSVSALQPQIGSSYRLTVTHANYDAVSSSTFIPYTVPFQVLDTSTVTIPNGEAFKFKIRFQDPAGQRNFYSFKVFLFYYDYIYDGMGNVIDSTLILNDQWISSSSVNVVDAGGMEDTRLALFSTDNLYNGQVAEIEVMVPTYFGGSISSSKFMLEFIHCSEEYYNFSRSLFKYYETAYDPFAQPVQIYSNIDQGIGIFAGLNPDFTRIR